MPVRRPAALGSLCAALAAALGPARAGDAGRRDFPATLIVEEPQVETEVSPQLAARRFGGARRADLSSDLAVKLAEPLSLIVNPDYTVLRPGGRGFQDLEVGLKYQFVADAGRELIVSAGLLGSLGGTGSPLVAADATSSLVPTLYYGKGGGDLPEALAYARPLAVTGQVALAVPTRRHSPASLASPASQAGFPEDGLPFEANPAVLGLAGSLQYSLPYAAQGVLEGRLPTALAALIPLVEYEIAVPVANTAGHAGVLGTINPGVLFVDEARDVTWGLELLIPINRASGGHPGARLQLSYSFPSPFLAARRTPD